MACSDRTSDLCSPKTWMGWPSTSLSCCVELEFGGRLATAASTWGTFKLDTYTFNHKAVYSKRLHALGKGCSAYIFWGLSQQGTADINIDTSDIIGRSFMGWQTCYPNDPSECHTSVADAANGMCVGRKGYSFAPSDSACPTSGRWQYCDECASMARLCSGTPPKAHALSHTPHGARRARLALTSIAVRTAAPSTSRYTRSKRKGWPMT